MAAIKGAIPWWGVPVNWIIGLYLFSSECDTVSDDLLRSHFRKPGRKLVLCGPSCEMLVNHLLALTSLNIRSHTDDSLVTSQPYLGYIQDFAMYARHSCGSTKSDISAVRKPLPLPGIKSSLEALVAIGWFVWQSG